MAQQRKASKHRRVALPDPVHKQMLVVCKGKHLGLKVRQLRSGVVIIKAFHDSASGEEERRKKNTTRGLQLLLQLRTTM